MAYANNNTKETSKASQLGRVDTLAGEVDQRKRDRYHGASSKQYDSHSHFDLVGSVAECYFEVERQSRKSENKCCTVKVGGKSKEKTLPGTARIFNTEGTGTDKN